MLRYDTFPIKYPSTADFGSLAILQGYNVDIRHIPGKKNPADSLSRQLVSDALVRKGSVKDVNAEYVHKTASQLYSD